MTHREFTKKLKTTFQFKKDDLSDLADDQKLVFKAGATRIPLRQFSGRRVNARKHFAAVVIMEAPGPDEIIHITERGKYFDHLYIAYHHKFYSVEELDDVSSFLATYRLGLSEQEYKALSPEKRLEHMPFFSTKPLARSLEQFFAGIQLANPQKKRVKPLGKALPRKSSRFSTQLELNNKRFWESWVENSTLTVRHGLVGTEGKKTVKKFSMPWNAAVEEGKLIRNQLRKGYKKV